MVKKALYPINAVLQDFWFLAHKNLLEYIYLCGKSLGYLILTIILSLVSISAALVVFQKLTKSIEEEKEISQNNIAVGLLLGGVLIAFAVIMESGISDFVNALIPIKELLN